MAANSLEIVCTACGEDALVKKEPVYDGFTKVGEQFVCVSCGHVYATEDDVPFKVAEKLSVFDADDKPLEIRVFQDEEMHKNCRYCKYYIMNPFSQRCGLHNKPVAATDFCEEFELKSDEKDCESEE